jgi:pimeloyl-ACP methyl ester carboxylesterase
MPRTADRIVDELHALLERAAIPPPNVLVGHSFGGLTMPLFAAQFPEAVAGMVLVDPVAPAEWNPPSEHDRKLTRIGAKVCRRAALLSRIGLIRFVAFLLTTGAKKPAGFLVRLISRGTPNQSGSVSSPWFSALPTNEKAMASVFWVQPKFALAIASQLENLPVSAARVGQLDHFCDKPTVILSARTAPEGRRKEHLAMAARLPFGQHVLAENSNHWIMQEEPDLVVHAIEQVAKYSEKAQSPAGTLVSPLNSGSA